MFSKAIDTRAPLHNLIAARWSGVAYDPDRDLSREQLLSLAEAARWAPSCFGDEPWRIIFCQRSEHPEAWQKAFDCLAEGNQDWNARVPVLALICCDTRFQRNDKANAYGEYDTGAAAMSICIQATHLGLMVHQMAGFDADQARSTFGIPERFTPKAMMAIGYQLPITDIPETLKAREMKDRQRRALKDSFFAGSWGEGL